MWNVLIRHTLKILWGGLLICFWGTCAVTVGYQRHLFTPILVVFLTGSALWGYLAVRIHTFGSNLAHVLRQLLSGNYEVGMEVKGSDELRRFARLVNKLSEQLVAYDTLRADRVSLNHRALDLMYRTVSEGIILADMEQRVFRLNPTVQSLFGVTQETFSFDAIENQQENEEFVVLFRQATDQEKIAREGRVVLHLPMHDAVRTLSVRIVPIKDVQEMVKLAFIFVQPD